MRKLLFGLILGLSLAVETWAVESKTDDLKVQSAHDQQQTMDMASATEIMTQHGMNMNPTASGLMFNLAWRGLPGSAELSRAFKVGWWGWGERLAIDDAISWYRGLAGQVQLGDPKDKVLSVLEPTQRELPDRATKPPETFKDGNDVIEVYFFRSGRVPDGLTTDDEFTPYVFRNGTLTSIGWTVLGGPKTSGKVVPSRDFTCMWNGPYLNCH